MSMAIDFAAIRRDYPLEAVVGKVAALRKSGGNKVAVCPLHPDKSPSFVLYKDDTFHCYGCSAHGDVIDFVAALKRLSISEAIKDLTGGVAPVMDDADRARRDAERLQLERQRKAREQAAIEDARARWARATPVNGAGNAYLDRKGVAAYGCRTEGDALIVPIYGLDGLVQSVQKIAPDGAKLFHGGAPVANGTLTLGNAETGPVIIAEGFATGATVQAATGCVVVVGFSKGALKATAQIVQRRYPGREIVIAADTNGVDAARDAAELVGGRVVAPNLHGADGTDFNDQAAHYGMQDVAEAFAPPAPPAVRLVRATPFAWRPTAQIPKREWLYGKHLLRKFVSLDIAAGGVGKSSLKVGEAIAMASGRDIYDKGLPEGALTTWFWNLEDPAEETERRIHATLQRFGIKPEQLGDRLYTDSGRDQPLVIATEGPSGAMIARPVVDALIEEMLDRKIDVLIVDPFISSHQVSENDNNAIDVVAREWNVIAERTGAAINLVHHVRKGNGAEATAESARGASSLIGKARSVLVYNKMTAEEAVALGADPDERRFYFRVDNDKANLAPPDATDWYRMNNEDLENGDQVGVACPWSPPDLFNGISPRHLYAVQKAISEGDWRENIQTKDAWVGVPIAAALGLDTESERDKKRIARLLKAWLAEGALEVVEKTGASRRTRKFVVVARWVEL